VLKTVSTLQDGFQLVMSKKVRRTFTRLLLNLSTVYVLCVSHSWLCQSIRQRYVKQQHSGKWCSSCEESCKCFPGKTAGIHETLQCGESAMARAKNQTPGLPREKINMGIPCDPAVHYMQPPNAL
jgi:hypothetical protein